MATDAVNYDAAKLVAVLDSLVRLGESAGLTRPVRSQVVRWPRRLLGVIRDRPRGARA